MGDYRSSPRRTTRPLSEKFNLTRRRILGGFATVGATAAAAGLGTTAYFSDRETYESNLIQVGELDLYVDYETSVSQDGVDTGSTTSDGTIDGERMAAGEYVVQDVKPGDSGRLEFCPKLLDNPGRLWIGSADGVTGHRPEAVRYELSIELHDKRRWDEACDVMVAYFERILRAHREHVRDDVDITGVADKATWWPRRLDALVVSSTLRRSGQPFERPERDRRWNYNLLTLCGCRSCLTRLIVRGLSAHPVAERTSGSRTDRLGRPDRLRTISGNAPLAD